MVGTTYGLKTGDSTDETADIALAQKAQKLVLWSMDEERGKDVVMAALQLVTNPEIAVSPIVRHLTFKAAQLLLADGESTFKSDRKRLASQMPTLSMWH